MTSIDLSGLTDEELLDLKGEISDEQARRAVLSSAPSQMVDLNAQYLDASGVVEGEPWVQPTGAHDAYPRDWIVTHEGQDWLSLVDANVWEPGVANWAVGSSDPWPAWHQPTGSTDAYPKGAQVSHLDLHWISDADANVWEPGVYGWTEE